MEVLWKVPAWETWPDWVHEIVREEAGIIPTVNRRGDWRDFTTGQPLTPQVDIDPLPPHIRKIVNLYGGYTFLGSPEAAALYVPSPVDLSERGKPKKRSLGHKGPQSRERSNVVPFPPARRNRRLGN